MPERSQTQKVKCCMIPFEMFEKGKPIDRKYVGGCLGLYKSVKFLSEVTKMS
jgi:hypothetical protein